MTELCKMYNVRMGTTTVVLSKIRGKNKLFFCSHRAPYTYQTPEVVVTIRVFPSVFDCCPVTLLGGFELFQAILNYA